MASVGGVERLRQLRASGERCSMEVLHIADKHWDHIHSLGNERTWRLFLSPFLSLSLSHSLASLRFSLASASLLLLLLLPRALLLCRLSRALLFSLLSCFHAPKRLASRLFFSLSGIRAMYAGVNMALDYVLTQAHKH